MVIGLTVGIKSSNGSLDKEGVCWVLIDSPNKPRSIATFCVALPFWLWVLEKVIKNGYPYGGLITFLLVTVSCVLVFGRNSNQAGGKTSSSSCPCIMLPISNVLVSLNYTVPLLLPLLFPLPFQPDLPLTFNVYPGVGGLYWAFICNMEVEGTQQRCGILVNCIIFIL